MPFFGKPFQPPKPSSPKTPPKPKPKTLFEEKKDWKRPDFLRRAGKQPFSAGGKGLTKQLNEAFSQKRFGTYVSEREAKTRLRELRKEETFAKTHADKQKAARLRKYLEKGTGLGRKY